MAAKESRGYVLFRWINGGVLLGVAVLSIAPMIHLVSVALSEPGAVNANQVGLLPIGLNLRAVQVAVTDPQFVRSFIVGVKRVVIGTFLNLCLTCLLAFPLSKSQKEFPLRTVYVWFFVFTMLFNGGLIPTYILVKELGLIDTIWALVLPTGVNVFFVVLLLNFFRQIPRELEEAAFIDGGNYTTSLVRIYLPLSLPAIATLVLFSMVFHWNSWFDGLIYANRVENYPLQTYLHILLERLKSISSIDEMRVARFDVARMAVFSAEVFIAIVPIIAVYPFLQRYFTTGIVLGSVKG